VGLRTLTVHSLWESCVSFVRSIRDRTLLLGLRRFVRRHPRWAEAVNEEGARLSSESIRPSAGASSQRFGVDDPSTSERSSVSRRTPRVA
jgi:hypothetical protein